MNSESDEKKRITRGFLSSSKRIFCFCLIIMQSLGIRFFDNQGTALGIAIMLLSYRGLGFLKTKDFMSLAVIIGTIFFSRILNPTFLSSAFYFQISLVFSSYLFLVQYRNIPSRLQLEFLIALKFFFYHALASYVLYLFIPEQFFGFKRYKALGYIFFIDASKFGACPRNTGLLWEPGVLQLLLNTYLFYCIKSHKNKIYLVLVALCVITSFSTAGFIVLLINVLFSFIEETRKKKYFLYFLLAGLVVLAFPIISANIRDKVDDENTSGQVRRRDFSVGIDLIKEKPVLGHGIFGPEYLQLKPYVSKTEAKLFSPEYLKRNSKMAGGYTNGLLGLIIWYGMPIGFFLYLLFYNNRFVGDSFLERPLFFLINAISFFGEPITYTSFFFLFPFSRLIFGKSRRAGYLSGKGAELYNGERA